MASPLQSGAAAIDPRGLTVAELAECLTQRQQALHAAPVFSLQTGCVLFGLSRDTGFAMKKWFPALRVIHRLHRGAAITGGE